MKTIIKMKEKVGDFAENKDLAREIRVERIIPALKRRKEVILDFKGVSGATQSFIHALVSEPIRDFHEVAFQKLAYKNANPDIREIISIVYRYMQESLEAELHLE